MNRFFKLVLWIFFFYPLISFARYDGIDNVSPYGPSNSSGFDTAVNTMQKIMNLQAAQQQQQYQAMQTQMLEQQILMLRRQQQLMEQQILEEQLQNEQSRTKQKRSKNKGGNQ